jgi:hypothetical protein
MSDISKVVDQIIKELESNNWSKSDRLQKVLEELVKIEVAKIDAGKL